MADVLDHGGAVEHKQLLHTKIWFVNKECNKTKILIGKPKKNCEKSIVFANYRFFKKQTGLNLKKNI